MVLIPTVMTVVLGTVAAAQEPVPRMDAAKVDKEVRRLLRELPESALDRRVALAGWAEEKGALNSMFRVLDTVLESDPWHSGAWKTLEHLAGRFRLAGPGGKTLTTASDYLRWMAGTGPSQETLAVLATEARPAAERREAAQAGLLSSMAPVRQLAVAMLARLEGRRASGPLVGRALVDPSSDVRRTAARSLAHLRPEGVPALLLQALDDTDARVRAAAAETLHALGDASHLPALRRAAKRAATSGSGTGASAYLATLTQVTFLRDMDAQVAQASAIADPQIGVAQSGSVLDVRVVSVRRHVALAWERRALKRAIAALEPVDDQPAAESR